MREAIIVNNFSIIVLIVNYFLVDKLIKNFKFGIANRGGRNFLGRVCVNGRGSGKKRAYRIIDNYRRIGSFGTLSRVIYDQNRTSFLGLILYKNGLTCLIILSNGFLLGEDLYSGVLENNNLMVKHTGWAVPLLNINLFTTINNIELVPYYGAKIAKAAGSSGILIGKFLDKALVKLGSGWQISVSSKCLASIGVVSNVANKFLIIGKAGKRRAFGFRPKVRGVAQNPCDHPHGGGNGKKSNPPAPVSAWGRLCKGTPTKTKKFEKRKRRLFKIF